MAQPDDKSNVAPTYPPVDRAADIVVTSLRVAYQVAVFTFRTTRSTLRAVLTFGQRVYIRIGEEIDRPNPGQAQEAPPQANVVVDDDCKCPNCIRLDPAQTPGEQVDLDAIAPPPCDPYPSPRTSYRTFCIGTAVPSS